MTVHGDVLVVRDLEIGLRNSTSSSLVRGVDFTVGYGERVGLVGESGSGKTLLALAIMGLQDPAIEVRRGHILLDGMNLLAASEQDLDTVRGAKMAMIYQNPMSSLNPVRTVGQQIAEAIRAHEACSAAVLRRRAVELLAEVGVEDPTHRVDDYPHEFSGGMRQRVMIAIAISCQPNLLLADEPTTALDVTTQARILELLDRLASERGMGVIFVTHDLAVAAAYCDRIAVMYAGRIVESGACRDVLERPSHPYTQALLDSVCTFELDPEQPMHALGGQPPLAGAVPSGCSFHPRCPIAEARCRDIEPQLAPLPDGRLVECLVRADDPGAEHGG